MITDTIIKIHFMMLQELSKLKEETYIFFFLILSRIYQLFSIYILEANIIGNSYKIILDFINRLLFLWRF